MRTFSLLLFGLIFHLSLLAAGNGGYHIEVTIDGYAEKELYLGYHYGDKQFLRDTAEVNDQGQFVFAGEEALPGGVYLVVMAPDNRFFQVLINEGEQTFSMKTKVEDPTTNMQVKGSPDNVLFYEYINFLAAQTPRAEKLKQEIEAAADDAKQQEKLQKQLEGLNDEVLAYQRKVIAENPGTLTAALIRANLPSDMPEFTGEEEEVQIKRWRYTQQHYFDNIDLADPRMLRTPFLFDRIDYFVHKLQVQHPDTISLAIDEVLERAKPAEETFKYYLIHFLNEYARSNIVGMDAVYVHLVENYYAKGLAPWTDEEQLKKIIDNATVLKPLLIGKVAPNIRVQKRDGTPIALHDVDAEYTILYFWRYDCGHCKQSTPDLKAFYEKFKNRGVELFAVCMKFTDEIPGCWDYIDDNAIGDWLHVVDPYHRSNYSKIYNIKSTPQLYILDRKKEIISKRIGAEQLEEVMDRIIEMKNREKEQSGSNGAGN